MPVIGTVSLDRDERRWTAAKGMQRAITFTRDASIATEPVDRTPRCPFRRDGRMLGEKVQMCQPGWVKRVVHHSYN